MYQDVRRQRIRKHFSFLHGRQNFDQRSSPFEAYKKEVGIRYGGDSVTPTVASCVRVIFAAPTGRLSTYIFVRGKIKTTNEPRRKENRFFRPRASSRGLEIYFNGYYTHE